MVAGGLVVFLLAGAGLWWTRNRAPGSSTPEAQTPAASTTLADATFVGATACAGCHVRETERWRLSMHARAMELPSSSSVEAPFSGETFTIHGVTSTFSRRDGKYVVRTQGADGAMQDFAVAYTFGVNPLQQYLLALPGGRLQALSISWDARSAPDGRRWFHLYPGTPLSPGDVQHWTSRSQNWNFMCAECHSTNVRKNHVAAEDRYETTWSDLNVACEACHGAGSRHVSWARGRATTASVRPGEDIGLAPLDANDGAVWTIDGTTGNARRDRTRTSRVEVEMCARCHSRRSQLTDEYRVGLPLAQSHRPSLLEEDLYFSDGQIRDEVYEYGSFLQSKMYANGVTCSDCHDPHTSEIAPDVCQRCHQTSTYATPSHHHHAPNARGSQCVSCHMPARTYMTVDVRRDHSFRVPRPDLTVKIGTPNACGQCHVDRPASWAAAQTSRWYGTRRASQPHYGEALAAGRSAAVDAQPRLLSVVNDTTMPAIVRATAISLIGPWVDAQSAPALQRAVNDADELVRMAAVDVLGTLPTPQRTALLAPLLADPIRSVRIQTARALATVPVASLGEGDRGRLTKGLAEWEAVQRFNADTAGARVSLGVLYTEQGATERARQEYETALRLEPFFAPAAVNLADLYRALGQDRAGEHVLRAALKRTPEVPALHRALGLLLVRAKNLPAALAELRRASELAPTDRDAQYTLAVALYSTGQHTAAIQLLDRTWRSHPGDRTILAALIAYIRERGDLTRAEELAGRLVELSPGDPFAQRLLSEIREARATR
jgi:Flp pilus assembly protein TadD